MFYIYCVFVDFSNVVVKLLILSLHSIPNQLEICIQQVSSSDLWSKSIQPRPWTKRFQSPSPPLFPLLPLQFTKGTWAECCCLLISHSDVVTSYHSWTTTVADSDPLLHHLKLKGLNSKSQNYRQFGMCQCLFPTTLTALPLTSFVTPCDSAIIKSLLQVTNQQLLYKWQFNCCELI